MSLQLRRTGTLSPPVDALIDTGAICSVISISSSMLLGLSQAQAVKAPAVSLGGVGGGARLAYRWQCDFIFGGEIWPDEFIYIYTGSLPYPVLIGQRSGFSARALVHIKKKTPGYVLIR
jgi:hypothetical protein